MNSQSLEKLEEQLENQLNLLNYPSNPASFLQEHCLMLNSTLQSSEQAWQVFQLLLAYLKKGS